MEPRIRTTGLLLLTLFVANVATIHPAAEAAATKKILGAANYRERVALTPNAMFEATLQDVSRADAPARVVARVRQANPGQVPIEFVIRFDPRKIVTSRRYVVRATIREGGRLLFSGSQPVLTRGNSNRVAILMRSVSAVGSGVQTGLENSRWVPTQIAGRGVSVTEAQREPWIELEPRSKRMTGSGGCNRISGGYEAGPGTLRFGQIMHTQMACPAMEGETAFLRALTNTRRYQVLGRVLELRDDSGRVLARLEERNLR